jgi:hypothetical protein
VRGSTQTVRRSDDGDNVFLGSVSHSSTSQLNLSRFRQKIHPKHRLMYRDLLNNP